MDQKDRKIWAKRVSESRGESWRKKLSKGRMDAEINPSYIRLARRKMMLRQEDIARKIAMKESTFGSIERGFRPVKRDAAVQIAKVLNMPMNRLFKPDPRHKNKFVAAIRSEAV